MAATVPDDIVKTLHARLAELGGNIARVTPGVVGATAKQQATIRGHAVVIEHKAAVITS